MCVSSQSMQRVAEVVIEACKRFAGQCYWFLLPDKRQTSSMRQVVKCFPRCSEGRRKQCSAVRTSGLVAAGVVWTTIQ